MRGNDGKARRSEVECALIDFYPILKESEGSAYADGRAKVLLLEAFFEIYDKTEGTQHSAIVKDLYMKKDSAKVNLQKIANVSNTDITTLWRYRKKYIKVMEYLRDLPEGSKAALLISLLSDAGKTK